MGGVSGEHGGAQLAGPVVGLAEGRGHAALAVAAPLEGDADQTAREVVGPGVVDALEVAAGGPAIVQRDQGAAVGAAVLERMDLTLCPPHHDDRHLAEEAGAVVTRLGEIGGEADVAPDRPLEDAAQLGAVVGVVLVDPVRHARQ